MKTNQQTNLDFQYNPSTDGDIHRGTLIFGDLLYVFRAFTRGGPHPETSSTNPPVTYLSIFGVSSERTVRFRIQRGEFIPDQDLQVGGSTLYTPSQRTLSKHPLTTKYQHTLSTKPITPHQ